MGFNVLTVGVKIEDSNTSYTTTKGCKVAFLTDEPYDMLGRYSPQQIHALRYSHVELGWFIHTTDLSFIDSLGCQNLTEYNKKEFIDPTTRCICDYNVNLRYASCACNSWLQRQPIRRMPRSVIVFKVFFLFLDLKIS